MRRVSHWAQKAQVRENRPFGAVVVSGSGELMASSTLCSSADPCVMCAGVVFGVDAVRLRVFRGDVAKQRDGEFLCRDVFSISARSIECIRPVMLNERNAPDIGY